MKETKRRAKALYRCRRLRGTAPLLGFFFLALCMGGAAVALFRVRLWLSACCLALAVGFICAFRLETRALTLTRATGTAVSGRCKRRTLLRLPLLALLRLGLLLAVLLPTAGLWGVFVSWRGAAYPPRTQQSLLLCCAMMTGVSLAFFLHWNALLRAAPALLLCGASFGQSLRCSVRLIAAKKQQLSMLRRSFFGWLPLCALLLPLPFAALYYRQCETLLLLNDA